MADIKTLQTRIALKYDTYANWTDDSAEGKGANLVLLPGEIGFCEIPSGNSNATNAPTVLFKVGNGEKKFSDLNWASALAADVYSWAKASDVRLTGKTIEFVGGKDAEGKDIIVKSIPLNYATPEEVAAAVKVVSDNLAGVDSRVTALESKFTGDGSVQGQIDALDGRLDAIEGAEGAIATGDAATLASAKSYADGVAATAESNAKTYAKDYADGKDAAIQAAKDAGDNAAAALTAYKSEMETALAGKQDVIPENTYDAHGAAAQALVDAKAYADQAELDAIAAAETASENKVKVERERIAALEAAKTAQDTTNENLAKAIEEEASARGTAVSGEATARAEADAAIEAKIGTVAEGKTVVKMIEDAQSAAAQDAANKITDLVNNGQVATNTSAIADLEQDLADEIEAREDVAGRVTTVENKLDAFFTTKDADGNEVGLDDALDTLIEIQKYITEDGSAADEMVKDIEANAQAIENLSKEFVDGGRVAAAEAAIDAVEADVADIESTLTGYDKDHTVKSAVEAAQGDATQALADALAASNKVDTKAAEIKTAYEAYADGKASAAQTAAEQTAATALSGAVETLNAKDAELQGKIDEKLDSATHLAGHAKSAADITSEINTAVAGEKSAREAAVNGINTKIGEVEGVVAGVKSTADTAASDIVAIKQDITDLETLTAGFDGTIKAAVEAAAAKGQTGIDNAATAQSAAEAAQGAAEDAQADVDALEKVVSGEDGKSGLVKAVADNTSDITAIKGDYLKMADLFIIDCGSSTKNIHTAN